MNAPRPLRPFVRTRTRLICTLALVAAVLVAASLPWWPREQDGSTEARDSAAPAAKDETTAMAEAVSTGKDVLVDTATSPTSQTWALPSGQLRSQFSAVPKRAKAADGRWLPVDNTLAGTGAVGELGVQPANPPTPVRFASGGTAAGTTESPLAEVRAGGRTITYTWPGALPEPVLDGSRALYQEVFPGVDLLLAAREEGGFGQLLIVKTRQAAATEALRSLNYGLRAKEAVFRHDANTGGVSIRDPATGAELGAVPTPFAWDSSAKDLETSETARTAVATSADVLRLSGLAGAEPGARKAPIPTRLDGNGTGTAQLRLDAAATGLLTDAKATYPLFLDPTINSGEQAWTMVHKKFPNSNFMNGTNFNGGTSEARSGYEEEDGGTVRSFWRMGFKNIKGAEVSSATFKVKNTHSWSCAKREHKFYFTGAISSGTTWNKQPDWTALQDKVSFAHGYNSSCGDDYVAFDIKDGANRAADAGSTSITFGIRASSETDTFGWRKFAATSAELTAVYNRTPAEPTDGTTLPGGACTPGPGAGRTIGKTDIVLKAKGTDPDGNLAKLLFRWWPTGGTVPAGTLVTPDSTGYASLRITSDKLTDKKSYSWDVRSEDTSAAKSSFFPAGTEPCRFTVDGSAPPAPDVESDVFLEATADGATWATVKFGQTGAITFTSSGAVKFNYSFGGVDAKTTNATAGKVTVADLKPPHAGPNGLQVQALDAVGNPSPWTYYTFYVPPRDAADGPGDIGGDGIADLIVIDANGNLFSYPGDPGGELYTGLAASYTSDGKTHPKGHWFDPATGQAALIAKHSDVFPGDGTTDLFARTPDGSFWLYPGDGYGSFNVDKRLRIMLPAGAPAPNTWSAIKATGDITGDKLPDLAVRAGTAFWVLSGYTGASFQQATLMEGTAWANREIVNLADVDLDGTPDLLWRNLDTGVMSVRHGKPGAAAGSVDLNSLKTAAASRQGDVQYGTNWTKTTITAAISIPDINGDKVPDLWARFGSNGNIAVYHPSKTNTNGPVKTVLGVNWAPIKGFA